MMVLSAMVSDGLWLIDDTLDHFGRTWSNLHLEIRRIRCRASPWYGEHLWMQSFPLYQRSDRSRGRASVRRP